MPPSDAKPSGKQFCWLDSQTKKIARTANLNLIEMSNWRKADVEQLIGLVRERPFLYNPKHRDYKNKYSRQRGFELIAAQLSSTRPGTTSEECRKKWHALRVNYMAERRKVLQSKKSGAGADELRTPSLFYFEEMGFLADTMEVRPHTSNLDEGQGPSATHEEEEWGTFLSDDALEEASMGTPSPGSVERPASAPPSSRTLEVTPRGTGPLGRGKKRRLESPVMEPTDNLLEAVTSALGSIQQTIVTGNQERDGEEDIFGRLVAQRLKNVANANDKSDIMFQIERIFFEYRNKN